jgi:hypothetical protein
MATTQIQSHTQLRGPRLALARAGWILLALLALGLFGRAIPVRYDYLAAGTGGAGRLAGPLQPEEMHALVELGLSLRFYILYDIVSEIAPMLLFLAIALVIFWRKPDDWIAMLVALTVILLWVIASPALLTLAKLRPAWQMPVAFVQVLGLCCLLLAFYLFPDGRFVPGITRWLALVWGGTRVLVFLFPDAYLPTPIADVQTLHQILILLWYMAWFGSGVVAQIYRFGVVSNPAQRQQTKWVVSGFAVMFVMLAIIGLPLLLAPSLRQPGQSRLIYDLTIAIPGAILALTIIPVCFGVAILRYRLFDIDLLINRTLVYGMLTGILALVYFAGVAGLQAVFHALTGGSSQLAVVGSTLIIAALFSPLRRRMQDVIDRHFYRRKYDAIQTLATFSTTVRDETDLDQLGTALLAVVEKTLQPAHVSLWLRSTEVESSNTERGP